MEREEAKEKETLSHVGVSEKKRNDFHQHEKERREYQQSAGDSWKERERERRR
jgi:hypothetical protein